MGTIYEKLDYLQDTKEAIKSAIQAKGVPVVDGNTFREYADLIGSIELKYDVNNIHLQEKTVNPTGKTIKVTPDMNYDALSQVTVAGDANLLSKNIVKDVTIYGVTGIADVSNANIELQPITITPNGQRITKTPDSGYDGFSQVVVNGDTNLVPDNIVSGVSIYGVVGEHVDEEIELMFLDITPTGEEFTILADDGTAYNEVIVSGDENLIPENIVDGVTIYGVTGEYVAPSTDPSFEIPKEYQEYVDYAMTNLYTGDFTNFMVLDCDDWLAVSFLMNDFTVSSFDVTTTEFKAVGWITCGYTKSTKVWTVHDYTILESPGGNYAKNIIYGTCYIYYNDIILFPTGINSFIKCTSIDFTDLPNGTFSQTLGADTTITYAVDYNDSGSPISITDPTGNIITITGLE